MTSHPFNDTPKDQSLSVTADSTKEYLVQNMSDWSKFIFVLTLPISLFLAFGIVLWLGGNLVVAFFVSIAAVVGQITYLNKYLQQKILVTIGKDSIRIHYLHSPFFVSTSDMYLAPSNIESYKYENFSGTRFILYMKDERRFRAAVGGFSNTETIDSMSEHIIALITDRQNFPELNGTKPRRRATYADGTTGLVLAILGIAAMIMLGIGIIFSPENHKPSDIAFGISVMFTCLAFVLRLFNLRRKLKKKKEEQTGENNGN